jgi:hypothetical protein
MVKRFSHETAESFSSPAALPSGEATSIKICVGSIRASRVRDVIWAMMVLSSRPLLRSHCTTTAGHTLLPVPLAKG